MTERRWCVAALLAGGVGFVVVAALRVPWHPVPGGMPQPVAASSVFSPAQLARAHAYSDPARRLAWVSLAVSLVVTLGLGLTPLGRRLAGRLRGPWWVRVLLAVLGLALVGRLATLPWAVASHRHAVAFGLTTQAWGAWSVDVGETWLLSVVVSAVVVLVLVASARRLGQAWPGLAGLVLAILVMVGSFVYPVLVEPAFNRFTPLPDGILRTQILHLAAVEHVRLDDVLVADASRRTTTLNAYVSGYGDTRRVVLYDTVLHDLPRAQILAIVAHELGHAHHDDVLTGSLLAAFGTLGGVGLLGLALHVVRRRPGALADPVVVPLVVALMALGTLLSSPVESGISRLIETRADVDSLRATHDPVGFADMQKQLALHSLGDDPPGWSQLWFGSHPTTLQRIAIARRLG